MRYLFTLYWTMSNTHAHSVHRPSNEKWKKALHRELNERLAVLTVFFPKPQEKTIYNFGCVVAWPSLRLVNLNHASNPLNFSPFSS